ncbi:hypothetical protein BJX63DRAFT_442677 [Aspergillus granulosus]|uniref:Uncharacterized protein n=1 Tax=Aspergillus granulosus TaxID=176169 RepID=A0ABR4HEU9_9EURO
MRFSNPVGSFDQFFSITRRQTGTDSVCWGGLGAGECLSSCAGVIYSNQCHDAPGEECCLHRECSTSIGNGWCRNTDNQTCEGEFIVGHCPGPTYIVCCVEWEDMMNDTSNSTFSASRDTTFTISGSTSFVPSSTATPGTGESWPTGTDFETLSSSSSGLTSSQKGGIAGGVIGAVIVTSLVFSLILFLRRRKRQRGKGVGSGGTGDGSGNRGKYRSVAPATEVVVDEGQGEEDNKRTMLASKEKKELDACGRALHEMDFESAVTPRATGWIKTKARKMSELPVSSGALVELPVYGTRQE